MCVCVCVCYTVAPPLVIVLRRCKFPTRPSRKRYRAYNVMSALRCIYHLYSYFCIVCASFYRKPCYSAFRIPLGEQLARSLLLVLFSGIFLSALTSVSLDSTTISRFETRKTLFAEDIPESSLSPTKLLAHASLSPFSPPHALPSESIAFSANDRGGSRAEYPNCLHKQLTEFLSSEARCSPESSVKIYRN